MVTVTLPVADETEIFEPATNEATYEVLELKKSVAFLFWNVPNQLPVVVDI